MTKSERGLRRYSILLAISIVVLGAYFWAYRSAFLSGEVSRKLFGANSIGSVLDASYQLISIVLYVFIGINAYHAKGGRLLVLALLAISISLYYFVPSAIVQLTGGGRSSSGAIALDSSIRLVIVGLISYLCTTVRALIRSAHGRGVEEEEP